VPKRTNFFQEVVEILHRHLAGDASVEPSAMLPSGKTGALREVDVVIRTTVASHEVLVGVEAIDRSRPADRGWVDQMVGKHADLPTDKLVLVSASGFTADARAAAVAANAIPLAPKDVVDGDLSDALIGTRPGVLTMEITLAVVKFGFSFDGPIPQDLQSDTAVKVTLQDGTEISRTPQDYAEFLLADRRDTVIAQLGLDRSRESRAGTSLVRFENLTAVVDDQSLRHGARDDDGVFFPLSSVHIEFDWKVDVTTLLMFRRSLSDQVYAAGEGTIAGREAMAVISHDDTGEGRLTLRVRPLPDEPDPDVTSH